MRSCYGHRWTSDDIDRRRTRAATEAPHPQPPTGTADAEAAEREEDPDRVPMSDKPPCRIVITYPEPTHEIAAGPADPPLHRPGRVNTTNTNADPYGLAADDERTARLFDQLTRESSAAEIAALLEADAERLARLLDQDTRETTTRRADPPARHTPNRT